MNMSNPNKSKLDELDLFPSCILDYFLVYSVRLCITMINIVVSSICKYAIITKYWTSIVVVFYIIQHQETFDIYKLISIS